MGEESGGEWIHVYASLSPFALPEAITTLFLNQLHLNTKYKVFFFLFFFFLKAGDPGKGYPFQK